MIESMNLGPRPKRSTDSATAFGELAANQAR